jgi:hypothetical protein
MLTIESGPELSAGVADVCCDMKLYAGGGSGATSTGGGAAIKVTLDRMWNKSKLRVHFHKPPGGYDTERINLIMSYAREWCQYGNIDFELEPTAAKADIRVCFDKAGYSSYVGTDCFTSCGKTEPTMTLQDLHSLALTSSNRKKLARKVRHEFGHALGMVHEHQLTDTEELLIPYDAAATIKWYKEQCGWDEDKVRHNVLRPVKKDGVYASKCEGKGMDQFSVMLYPLSNPKLLTQHGLAKHFPEEESHELSAEDKIHVMRMYPDRCPPAAVETSTTFRCGGFCNQYRASGKHVDNPRFRYSINGKCLLCAWSKPMNYTCRTCKHEQHIPCEIPSDTTWACYSCDRQRLWRPNFR